MILTVFTFSNKSHHYIAVRHDPCKIHLSEQKMAQTLVIIQTAYYIHLFEQETSQTLVMIQTVFTISNKNVIKASHDP